MPGVTTDEEWKLNEDDVEKMQTNDSQHSPEVDVVPNAYLNQMMKFENMKKGRGTDESDKEKATHVFLHLQVGETQGGNAGNLRPCIVTVD